MLETPIFQSVPDFQDAITHYTCDHNRTAKLFVWTKPADIMIGKLARLPAPSA